MSDLIVGVCMASGGLAFVFWMNTLIDGIEEDRAGAIVFTILFLFLGIVAFKI